MRTLGGDGSTYARHIKVARFAIPTSSLLGRVVDMSDLVPMEDRDTKRVLFLADRVASVNQAVAAFKAHLPSAAPVTR